LLSLVLLIGLVGGLALGSLAAARRTQSSFSTYLASTNPADLGVTIYGANANNASSNPSYSAKLTSDIARLPHVRDVAAGVLLQAAPLRPDGSPRLNTVALAYPIASVNGLYFDQDRVTVTQGRMANPNRPDEIMMTALAAHQLGFHVGQKIPYGIYSQAQESEPGIGTQRVPPTIRFTATLVGLATQSSEIVEDDIDRVPTFIILTPALAREAFADLKTFGSSPQTLVTHPPLYGWNWTYMLSQVGSGGGNVPPQAFSLLDHDSDVAAYTGLSYNDAELDGHNTPFLFGRAHAEVTPAILSGHAVENKHQIVLGAATMAQLHKQLGDSVFVSYGSLKDAPIYVPRTRLVIVGTATMPAVGFASIISDHTSMGTGAFVATSVLPVSFQKAMESHYPTLNGSNLALV
jgi:hypothetical protein